MSNNIRLYQEGDKQYFQLGDIVLTIPPENISISRHENHQLLSYLRNAHAMRINTGRANLRIDISFKVQVDKTLDELQNLVAMSRVTPFVPVINTYIQNLVRLIDDSPDIELSKTAQEMIVKRPAERVTSTTPVAIPMAIMGFSTMMGGDSPEIADCQMSLVYWNPYPFISKTDIFWKRTSFIGLSQTYSKYITGKINKVYNPNQTWDVTLLRWWDVAKFSELKHLVPPVEAEANAEVGQITNPTPISETEEVLDLPIDDLDIYLRNVAKSYTAEDLVDMIPSVESSAVKDPFTAKNPTKNSSAAGKWQLVRTTFKDLFFNRNFKDMLKEKSVREKYGITNDPELLKMIETNAKPSSYKVLNSKETYQDWYARPEMAGIQRFMAEQHLKQLLNRHDGDSVAAVLEYFLGGNGGNKYINAWKTSGVVLDWTTDDIGTHTAENNTDPRTYVSIVFKSKPSGFKARTTNQALSNASNDRTLNKGFIYTYKNQELRLIAPIVSATEEEGLKKLGWLRIDDITPATDPLFYREVPKEIVFTANGNVASRENQVVTSISVNFQNRFANLPIQGWPSPTMQHLGSIDSDIRVMTALISYSEAFEVAKQLKQMLVTMDLRSKLYRTSIYSGKEIFTINRVSVQNRFLNGLGISDVIITDVSIIRDPDSPDLARLEVILVETGIVDEEIRGHLGKSDVQLTNSLREFVIGKKYISSENQELVALCNKVNILWDVNEQCRINNLDAISSSGFGKVENNIAKPEVRKSLWAKLFDGNYEEKNTNFTSTTQAGIRLYSAKPLSPALKIYIAELAKIPDNDLSTPINVNIPLDPNEIVKKDIFQRAADFIQDITGQNPNADVSYLRGEAARMLGGSYGKEIHSLWLEMEGKSDAELRPLLAKWLELWANASHEWYKDHVIDQLIYNIYRMFPNDPGIRKLISLLDSKIDRDRGCYRDLFISDDVSRNPYDWIDAEIIPRTKEVNDILFTGTLNYMNNVFDAYQKTLDSDEGGEQKVYVDIPLDIDYDSAEKMTTPASLPEQFKQGVKSMLQSNQDNTVKGALQGINYLDREQFSVRRAFPTFKIYFVEEDNQGLFKRFDDFYSYNAIVDINMIMYKSQPSTAIITMSNLFGHLDAKTFDDVISKEDLLQIVNQAITEGRLPVYTIEKKPGINTEYTADGKASDIRNIMLKPGTKLVIKMGYDNDPDKLPLIFAGQITEVTTGDVITVVAQDWMSELAGQWDDRISNPTDRSGYFGLKRLMTLQKAYDFNSTLSPKLMLQAILSHKQARHFGNWQMGPPSPFAFSAFSFPESYISKLLGERGLASANRAFANINVQPIPFYSAFGTQTSTEEMTEELVGKSLWDIVEHLRLRNPNHIAMVKPFGQGDATLYFGPPYGTYRAADFESGFTSKMQELQNNGVMFDIFKKMIRNNTSIYLNDPVGATNPAENGYWVRTLRSIAYALKIGDESISNQKLTIAEALSILSAELFKQANQDTFDKLQRNVFDSAAYTGEAIEVIAPPVLGFHLTTLFRRLANRIDRELVPGILTNNPSDEVIKAYYDAIIEVNAAGGLELNNEAESALVDVVKQVFQLIDNEIRIRASIEPDFDKDEIIRNGIKPVRKWHFITSSHHIISNNIMVNANFANKVDLHGASVRFDPGLTDVRTANIDSEFPKSLSKTTRNFIAANVLAEEMQNMYQGEIIIAGNANIQPHDIIIIFDDVRHIHGGVIAAKVQHSFNQETGFITIISPAALTEVADMTWGAAIQSFFARLTRDIQFLKSKGAVGESFAEVYEWISNNLALAQYPELYASTNSALFPGNAAPSPSLLPFVPLTMYYIAMASFAADFKQHPISILPLSKRGYPWLGGIDGAAGRSIIGQVGDNFIVGLRGINTFFDSASELKGIADRAVKSISEFPTKGDDLKTDEQLKE